MKQTRIGLPQPAAPRTMPWATASTVDHLQRREDGDDGVDVWILGRRHGWQPRTAAPWRWRSCPPGWRRWPRARRTARILLGVAASVAICRPSSTQASVARMPGPPELVTIATPVAARHRLARECRGVDEQLLDAGGSGSRRSARTATRRRCRRRPASRCATRRRARPPRCAPTSRRRSASSSSHPPRDLQEPLRVAEALEVHQDDPRPRIVLPSTPAGRCPRRRPCCRATRTSRGRARARAAARGSPRRARRDCDENATVARHRLGVAENVACSRNAGSLLMSPCSSARSSRMPYRRTMSTTSRSSTAPGLADLLEPRRDDHRGPGRPCGRRTRPARRRHAAGHGDDRPGPPGREWPRRWGSTSSRGPPWPCGLTGNTCPWNS